MLSSRDADDVPLMNCNDAREGLSVLSRYGMGLTEWVLADAHVRQCAECRKALENLQELVQPSSLSASGQNLSGNGQCCARRVSRLRWCGGVEPIDHASIAASIVPTKFDELSDLPLVRFRTTALQV
jgi:hypothetical protein